MSDKDFWVQAYFEAYKTMLSVKGKKLFDANTSNIANEVADIIDSDLAFCTEIADCALDYFKINMAAISKYSKEEIKKKNDSKTSYK